jgi:hypothetical protein
VNEPGAIIDLQLQSIYYRDLLQPWRVYVRNRYGVYHLRGRSITLDGALELARKYGTREIDMELPL